MTYAYTYDVPINAEIYARIKEGLGPDRPPGLIAHLAWRIEGGLRYVDVWQSKDDRGLRREPAAPRRAPDPAGDARLRAARTHPHGARGHRRLDRPASGLTCGARTSVTAGVCRSAPAPGSSRPPSRAHGGRPACGAAGTADRRDPASSVSVPGGKETHDYDHR